MMRKMLSTLLVVCMVYCLCGSACADARDTTWCHDASYDDSACKLPDVALMKKAYALIRDIPLNTIERTRACMTAALPEADWTAC